MDSSSEEANSRQISQYAAERYARPPPPVPVGVHGPTPPPRPPHLPERAPHTGGYGITRSHRDPPLVPDQVIPVHRDSVPITYRRVDRGPTHVEIPHRFNFNSRSVPINVAPSNRGFVDFSTQSRSLNSPLRPQRDLVTLAAMRKHRARNEYTETPSLVRVQIQNNNNDKALQLLNSRTTGLESQLSQEPIISQPSSSALKKEVRTEPVDLSAPCQEAFICSQCGKCRCGVCMQQRPLPSRWICRNKCECSAQKCVEYCTCVWLVKGIFYHCLKDRQADEEFQLDEPCACCDQPHCCKRWTCMAAMSLCLPCLCLYWPLQCGLDMCTSCYNQGRGCRCRKDRIPGSKGLLLDSESSSA